MTPDETLRELLLRFAPELLPLIGSNCSIEVDGVRLSISVEPVPPAGLLFDPGQPPEGRFPDELRESYRAVYEAVRWLRESPGGAALVVRPRHVVRQLEELSDGAASRHTVAHALAALRKLGLIDWSRRYGYTVRRVVAGGSNYFKKARKKARNAPSPAA